MLKFSPLPLPLVCQNVAVLGEPICNEVLKVMKCNGWGLILYDCCSHKRLGTTAYRLRHDPRGHQIRRRWESCPHWDLGLLRLCNNGFLLTGPPSLVFCYGSPSRLRQRLTTGLGLGLGLGVERWAGHSTLLTMQQYACSVARKWGLLKCLTLVPAPPQTAIRRLHCLPQNSCLNLIIGVLGLGLQVSGNSQVCLS